MPHHLKNVRSRLYQTFHENEKYHLNAYKGESDKGKLLCCTRIKKRKDMHNFFLFSSPEIAMRNKKFQILSNGNVHVLYY